MKPEPEFSKSDYLIAAIFCFAIAIVGAWFLLREPDMKLTAILPARQATA